MPKYKNVVWKLDIRFSDDVFDTVYFEQFYCCAADWLTVSRFKPLPSAL